MLISELRLMRGPTIIGEAFGIEIEAERFPAEEMERVAEGIPLVDERLIEAQAYWSYKQDGSLRHNGVELVSRPLSLAQTTPALRAAEKLFAHELVRTSLRAGIHVHYNVQHLEGETLVAAVARYVVAEPLLYQIVGVEREQNIYCVPWYRSGAEWRAVLSALRTLPHTELRATTLGNMRALCKYSGLYLAPMLSLGSVEFRMAPTWTTADKMAAWVRVVRAVMGGTSTDPDEIFEELSRITAEVFPPLDRGLYLSAVDKYGLRARVETVVSPCTYKVPAWGAPASTAFGHTTQMGFRPEEREPYYPDDFEEEE